MKLYLVDGTYELFRAYFALPSMTAPGGREVGAVRGLTQSMLSLLRQEEVSHIACAFDHVVESFRNELFAGYKTGEGVPLDLKEQFELAERAVSALGVTVWPMVEFEADDALGAAASRWQDSPNLEQIVICSPDKDLAQMVVGDRVVCLDRRREVVLDQAGVEQKFGVAPESIPDYLALVGDSADGIPGVPRWGAKSTAQVLARYQHIEDIPQDPLLWDVKVRGAKGISGSLAEHYEEALLYRRLATLRLDVPLPETLEELEWRGVRREEYLALRREMGFGRLAELPHKWIDA